MSDDGPILAYASPTSAVALDTAAGDFTVTFAPPPVGVETAVNAAGACLAAAGVAAVAWVAIKLGVATNPWAAFVPGLVVLVLAGIVCRRVQCIVRMLRFGRLPVTLAVRNGVLHMSSPAQWGLETHVYGAETIVRCRAALGGWSTGTRLAST